MRILHLLFLQGLKELIGKVPKRSTYLLKHALSRMITGMRGTCLAKTLAYSGGLVEHVWLPVFIKNFLLRIEEIERSDPKII